MDAGCVITGQYSHSVHSPTWPPPAPHNNQGIDCTALLITNCCEPAPLFQAKSALVIIVARFTHACPQKSLLASYVFVSLESLMLFKLLT